MRLSHTIRRLPAHILNGISVALGIGFVQLLIGAFAGASFTQLASTGAVLASLPHLTARCGVTLRRTLAGGSLAVGAGVLLTVAEPFAWLRALTIGVISFASLLAMAWGLRAGPLVFSVIIGMIFALARPSGTSLLEAASAGAAGVALYGSWAWLANLLLERRYRELAVAEALRAAAKLLRARARVLSETHPGVTDESDARLQQLKAELGLAQALQVARDLVHPAKRAASALTHAALLSRLGELREIVLTSRLDLELLGDDHVARFVRARLALGLRLLSESLDSAASAAQLLDPIGDASHLPRALPDLAEAREFMTEGDARTRLLPTVALRLRYLNEEVEGMKALLAGHTTRSSLPPEDLSNLVSDGERWPLSVVLENCSLRSPTFRHALRSALAFVCVYLLAPLLPWTTRPYWLLLSVAVVLRGTLDDTLSRRNARVLGTALGCVLVALAVPVLQSAALKVAFVAAVGVSHAFVNVRYLLTAISATLMALLQAHLNAPSVTPLVLERLLDTVLGAAFAWAFSYVLPSWERRTLPVAVERALAALRVYARSVLASKAAIDDQRLARQRAYDALGVVSAALKRSAAEPRRVRPPVDELVRALDHAQRLMAHLSSLRSLLRRRAAALPPTEVGEALAAARDAIDAALALRSGADESRPKQRSFAELPAAPVEQAPLPWLLRRLDASVYDATESGRAARRVLALLARPKSA